jgi:hypothetical protein
VAGWPWNPQAGLNLASIFLHEKAKCSSKKLKDRLRHLNAKAGETIGREFASAPSLTTGFPRQE